jgi:hypothetical protein
VSGAGALRLGAEFLARTVGYPISYISKETWGKLQTAHLKIANSVVTRKPQIHIPQRWIQRTERIQILVEF